MTDTPASTPVMRKGHVAPGWTPVSEGKLVEKLYKCESGDEAAKMAKRLIALSYKSGQTLELRIDADELTIRLPAVDGKVRNEVAKMIRKLPGSAPGGKHSIASLQEAAADKRGGEPDDDA